MLSISTRRTFVSSAALLLASSAGMASIDLKVAVNYPTPTTPSGVVTGDFDKDGDLDLAITTDTPDKVSILTNKGNGEFAGPVNFAINNGSGAGHVVAADLDGDNDVDLAIALQNNAAVRIMLNDGGTFTEGTTNGVGANPRWIRAAELNGLDGVDLAVVNRDSGTVSILLNDGNAGFTTTTINLGGGELRAAANGDFDKDGDIDLAVTNHDDRTIQILANNGAGAFTLSATLQSQDERPSGIAATDLDGDGDADLVSTIDKDGPGFVLAYINNAGAFLAPKAYATGAPNPGTIVAADLDDDGDMDVATSNEDSGNISALSNNGNGTFAAAVLIATGAHPERIAWGDFDQNGGTDLAVANRDAGTTSVLLNNTGANCAPDLDGNGVTDLFDFLAFTNLFNAGNLKADFDANGVLDLFDFLAFTNAFNAGC